MYIFQRNIDMSSTNTFAVYHIGTTLSLLALDSDTIEQRKLEVNAYSPVSDQHSHIYLLRHDDGLYSDYRYKVIDFDTCTTSLILTFISCEHVDHHRHYRNPTQEENWYFYNFV